MKELVIISGKGGTGKTSLTGAFAHLAERPVLCDADVDAADLHLLLSPDIRKHHNFFGGHLAVIDKARCTTCGYCRELCRFEAISEHFHVDPINCEGCGVCVDLCPEKAIDFPMQKSGQWYISETRLGHMVHARLGIAEENSGKLVSLIRRQARDLAEQKGHSLILTDGPPGIGCPVIGSISGADGVVIVVEPTVSGKHDVERVARLAEHFHIPAMHNVNALLVGGIGMRPLMGFRQVGITVYHEAERAEIKPVVLDLLAGKIPEIRDNQVCGGGTR